MMTDCMLRGDCCDDAAPLLRCQVSRRLALLLASLLLKARGPSGSNQQPSVRPAVIDGGGP